MNCRGYACDRCWNDAVGRCLNCAPVVEPGSLAFAPPSVIRGTVVPIGEPVAAPTSPSFQRTDAQPSGTDAQPSGTDAVDAAGQRPRRGGARRMRRIPRATVAAAVVVSLSVLAIGVIVQRGGVLAPLSPSPTDLAPGGGSTPRVSATDVALSSPPVETSPAASVVGPSLPTSAATQSPSATESPPLQTPSQSSPASPAPTPLPTASLARPLHLPAITPGAACPHSVVRVLVSTLGPALGPGPVNPVGVGTDAVVSTAAQGGTWTENVTWISAPSYTGPALVRGRRLDGSGVIDFGTGVVASDNQLSLPTNEAMPASGAPGWRQWRSVVAVHGPGCYGFQVDGVTFSTLVLFEAR
jgi:hypothetical protein